MADKELIASQGASLPSIKPKPLTMKQRVIKIKQDFQLRGILPNLTKKRRAFLSMYLDMNNKTHFFNALQCVKTCFNPKKSGTARAMAWEYQEILSPWIEQFLNDLQFTDEYIKARVLTLMHAKQTKFFSYQGKVCDSREIEALDVQLKATILASEIKGMKKTKDIPPQAVFNINFGDMDVSFSGPNKTD